MRKEDEGAVVALLQSAVYGTDKCNKFILRQMRFVEANLPLSKTEQAGEVSRPAV